MRLIPIGQVDHWMMIGVWSRLKIGIKWRMVDGEVDGGWRMVDGEVDGGRRTVDGEVSRPKIGLHF